MRLKHMQFYGHFDARCDVAGFSIARMVALNPAHQVEPHEHEDGHFIVVLSGLYRSSARGVDTLLEPGGVLWNPPGTRHVDTFAGTGGRFLALSVKADLAQALGLADGGARRLLGATRQAALALAAQPLTSDLGGLLDAEETCQHLCLLTRGGPERGEALWQPGAERGEPLWLRRCMEQLLEECEQPLQLAALARTAGVHPVSMSRAFRRHYGISPGQLQRRAQLNRAAQRLKEGRPIAEVAASLGFADQSHFTRLFRAEYRCTPAAWREGFKTF
ncbi:helix-turn-helix transcriptional regulator [Roseateles amylovorans]|uniref:AraC family transcriptional regulator n=1 Tax=Roseateles amylovorans TaxID=2978473 RepID=A0ABY6B1H3_9BURK|nr:AraC family transcriptional regulator [Roseateles amylovorans]UXH79245.1 AraC family transcriptional regulator [Roseateles amylovorans]